MRFSSSFLFVLCGLFALQVLAVPNEEMLKRAYALAKQADKKMNKADNAAEYQGAINSYQFVLDTFTAIDTHDTGEFERINGDIADVLWNMGICHEVIATILESEANLAQALERLKASMQLLDRSLELYRASDRHWTNTLRRRYLQYVDSIRLRLAELTNRLAPPVVVPPPAPPLQIEFIQRAKKRKQSEPKRSLNRQNINPEDFMDFGPSA